MPTIRFLTPADLPAIFDIIDAHGSGASCWANDRDAPERFTHKQLNKTYVENLFIANLNNLFGHFNDSGSLMAYAGFARWQGTDSITLLFVSENPNATLGRIAPAIWSDEAVDVVNWGIGYFWCEGTSSFFSRIYTAGRESNHISNHPNCQLHNYTKDKIVDVPENTVPAPEFERISRFAISDPSAIYKFTDPFPLSSYIEQNIPQVPTSPPIFD